MMIHPPKAALNPMLFVGFLLASIGAGMVLYSGPAALGRARGPAPYCAPCGRIPASGPRAARHFTGDAV